MLACAALIVSPRLAPPEAERSAQWSTRLLLLFCRVGRCSRVSLSLRPGVCAPLCRLIGVSETRSPYSLNEAKGRTGRPFCNADVHFLTSTADQPRHSHAPHRTGLPRPAPSQTTLPATTAGAHDEDGQATAGPVLVRHTQHHAESPQGAGSTCLQPECLLRRRTVRPPPTHHHARVCIRTPAGCVWFARRPHPPRRPTRPPPPRPL